MTTTIYIDGIPHEARKGDNLLQTVLSSGLDLPYFCWHPALGSVGACRQCAVKVFRDESDSKGRIVMACMTPVQDGLRISLKDIEATTFRAAVVGWMMTNHPHDCPVCDEGGECHLQDMTVMAGHTYRQYRFTKRTFRNQNLGPLIHHEMNRCIQCFRCVRFYRDTAGGTDLDVFGSRNKTYFGRFEDGTLESPFSGNLAEICPTGVFTDKTLKGHYTRKWDLQSAPSICTLCSLGCNTLPGERYGTLRRILNRYNPAVNGYFLCDRGRFGYEFVNSPKRVRQPFIGRNGENAETVSPDEAVRRVAAIIGKSKGVVGIGSPTASLESNYALRQLVGADHFFNGMATDESRDVAAALEAMTAVGERLRSLEEVKTADAIFVLGEDITHTAPLLALSVRQAVQTPRSGSDAAKVPPWDDAMKRLVLRGERRPLFIAAPCAGELDDAAALTYRAAPADIARLGFAVAHAVDRNRPQVLDLADEPSALSDKIAGALATAERPLVIVGLAAQSQAVKAAAVDVINALETAGKKPGLFVALPECNTAGVSLLSPCDLSGAFDAAARGRIDTAIILENDIFRRAEEASVIAFLDKIEHLVVVDSLENRLTERAQVVLPAATFAESDGTLVNAELRAQRYHAVFPPGEIIRAGFQWMTEILTATGQDEIHWMRSEDVIEAAARTLPIFEPAAALAREAREMPGGKVPRQSPRYSGRTAMSAHLDVSEPKPPEDNGSPLAFSMEGTHAMPPPALTPRYWAPGWNSVQALNKFQEEVGGDLRGPTPGRRLAVSRALPHPTSPEIPPSFKVEPGRFLVVGIHHLFGTEPRSLETPALATLAPAPYAALRAEDLAALGIAEGDTVEVRIENGPVLLLPLKVRPDLAAGLIALPWGLAGMPFVPRGARAEVGRVS